MVGGHVKPIKSIIVDNNDKIIMTMIIMLVIMITFHFQLAFSAPISQAVVEESVQITLGPSGFKCRQ